MKFEPINAPSSTDLFVDQIKTMILTHQLNPGDQLPSERELETQLSVSRSVINNGFRRLARLHFIDMLPRQGNFVADYKVTGTLATIAEVIQFRGGNYRPSLLKSIYQMRQVVENDMVRLACLEQNQTYLRSAKSDLEAFTNADSESMFAENTFNFFRNIALASGNEIYPIITNSLHNIYVTLSGWNSQQGGQHIILKRNEDLLAAIEQGNSQRAVEIDRELIKWSLSNLLK